MNATQTKNFVCCNHTNNNTLFMAADSRRLDLLTTDFEKENTEHKTFYNGINLQKNTVI